MTNRFIPEERRDNLFTVAMVLAIGKGYTALTFNEVAEKAQVTRALLYSHFKNNQELKKEVLAGGCDRGLLSIIIEGVLRNEDVAKVAAKNHQGEIISFLFGDL